MAHVYFAITVLLSMSGSCICENEKRLYYFRQKDAKTNNNTIMCALKLINVDSKKARHDHITGQCDTTATTNTNGTGLIQFAGFDALFPEVDKYGLNMIESAVLPRVLGYGWDGHDTQLPTIFEVNLTKTPQDSDWIEFLFEDLIDFIFTCKLTFNGGNMYMKIYTNNTVANKGPFGVINNGEEGVVDVRFNHGYFGVDVYFDEDLITNMAEIDDYRPVEYIGYSSTFASCDRVSFTQP